MPPLRAILFLAMVATSGCMPWWKKKPPEAPEAAPAPAAASGYEPMFVFQYLSPGPKIWCSKSIDFIMRIVSLGPPALRHNKGD